MKAPTERHGYSEWLIAHREDPEKFLFELTQYLVTPDSWSDIAKYEFDCIDKVHSKNLWSTWEPFTNPLAWESFSKWFKREVCDNSENTFASYLSDRLFSAHSKLSCKQLLDIGPVSVLTFYSRKINNSAMVQDYSCIYWIPLLSDAKPTGPAELHAKIELVSQIFNSVSPKALEAVLAEPFYWAEDMPPVAMFAYLLPECPDLFTLYESLALTHSEIADALSVYLATTSKESLSLPSNIALNM